MGSKLSKQLLIIVVAQFLCTSLWFAGNAVMSELKSMLSLDESAFGTITSSVQLGFISGTLLFAIFSISDRFSPSKVFMTCALLGAAFNLLVIIYPDYLILLLSRTFVGFWLAGIYPVGMKIASDYHEKGLGKALGYLVGALVLGTALPYLLHSFPEIVLSWEYVMLTTSCLASIGGLMIGLFIPDGPYRKKSPGRLQLMAAVNVFKNKKFRASAFGYFGHMWELYTFWAFLPLIILSYITYNSLTDVNWNSSLLTFFIIAGGFVSCVVGGKLSLKKGSARVAFYAQLISFFCCLAAPFALLLPPVMFVIYLFVWGLTVIADSPQFSTLIASNAPNENKGTALTIVNSIGFAITIVSIQFMSSLIEGSEDIFRYLPILAVGPGIGLKSMYPLIWEDPI